ncbi:MAG TPA: hypothetical protein DDX19_26125 [Rhodopirellula baltica]|uniref:Uncharacterized protein n=1 Tax=Rhodopirellula baltica (strain DSM 10527 / NCIMB 13988 / SH1) TaxID=243090 RepID=Q7UWQ5_RHOBA|nr:hypothetical protein [Rhodopirellula baltica]CAD72307.1 hypothetical protein-transmembrane prediction [Rhodopirellula baltica SH 1]HBE66164.1 hypothetical protein [Rhodopirellula baltica]
MSQRASDFRYRLWMWCPPILVVLAIAWGVGREYWAKGEYRSVVNEMADSGVPITTTQIYDRYTAAETDEQSAEWTELFDAVTALREMSRDSVEGLDDLVPPDESWPAEPFAALMSKEAQPLIQKLEDLLKSDAPIPGEVTFSSRRLWMSGSNYGAIPELLEDEFQMAYHSGDTERAITLVRQWSQFIELLGQSNGFQAWSQWSLSKRWLRLVRQSVTHAFWNEEQLTELVALTNEIRGPDLDEWNESLLSGFVAWDPLQDKGSWVRFTDPDLRSIQPFGASAIHAMAALEWMQPRDATESDRGGRRDRNSAQQKRKTEQAIIDGSRSFVSVPFATLNRWMRQDWDISSAYGIQQNDNFRDSTKWTLTAIYMRKYQVENGRFPRSLDSLRSAGADDRDWTLSTGERLGYRADDGSQEEDQAIAVLWTDDKMDQGEFSEPGVGRIPYSERKWGAGRAENYEIWFDRNM